ncbi:MAG TPA: choice-of-anchor J domain-containing protein, partial [Pyrinomonadaceae bacterium]|nr:choice-of-anchor J domain-containing protein [Pyrinomonadaceae bacterium]
MAVVSMAVFGFVNIAKAQAITEGFDNITTLPGSGWFTQNNSVPVGTTGWFQGNPAVFPAQAGATNSYIGAN